jgi:phosphotransferase system  glucose/maltose/N-acetylglucosamine-specific IIC component
LTAPTYVAPPIAYFLFGAVGAVLAVVATAREREAYAVG